MTKKQKKDSPHTGLDRHTETTTRTSTEPGEFGSMKMAAGKKSNKKKIIFCTVGSLVIAAVIAVVAIFVSKSSFSDNSGGDHPSPTPVNPGTPLDFKEYNPFKLDINSIEEQDWYLMGYINNTHQTKDSINFTRR